METIEDSSGLQDSVVLGACCFSSDGISRCNGEVEGTLGSIRLFGVMPRYHGYCIGARLLQKIEDLVFKKGCVRIMCCIPSPRLIMQRWVVRRNYISVGSTIYPAAGVGHVLKSNFSDEENPARVELIRYMKTKPSAGAAADTKDPKILSLVPDSTANTHGVAAVAAVLSNSNAYAATTTTKGSIPRSSITQGVERLRVSQQQFEDHGSDYDVDSASDSKGKNESNGSDAAVVPQHTNMNYLGAGAATTALGASATSSGHTGGSGDRRHLPPAWRANPPIYEEDMAEKEETNDTSSAK
jgi:hypothetical protein